MKVGRYKAYPEYKDSGVEWLGEIPAHWSAKKLKYLANVQPSNIDKKAKPEEAPVALCNYTDVYYNDNIGVSIDFMKATATDEQIAKFTLRAGDTIVTKDSEDPKDIAVPAFVPEDIEGVVCGYHLAMIRPFVKAYGALIKRNFESGYARAYFTTRSNGLTRYGLGSHSLGSAFFLKPPTNEAETIANFLDHETAKIDTLIDKQQQLIALLKEKRQAVISHAVTRGLNPDIPMKDSGVEWLGEVPEHWRVAGLKKYIGKIVDYRGKTPEKVDAGIFLVTARNIKNGSINYTASQEYIAESDYENVMSRGKPKIGDVLFTTEAPLGEVACVDREDIALAQRIIKFDGLPGDIDNNYLKFLIMSRQFQQSLMLFASGSTALGIKAERLVYLRILVPPEHEQLEIVKHIETIAAKLDELIVTAEMGISLIHERRTALISAAVTGRIDVRNWQPPTEIQANKDTP